MEKNKLLFTLVIFVIALATAEMSSTNYIVDSDVVSSGGGEICSGNYCTETVLGVVSGEITSANYINDVGYFNGLGAEPNSINNPNVSLVFVDADNLTTSDLNCSANITDDEGDDLNASVRWYKNGALNLTINYDNSYPNGTLFNATLDFGNTTKHDNWSCSVRLYDGKIYSDWNSSENVTVLNSEPEVFLDFPLDGSSISDRTPTFNWTVLDNDNDTLIFEFNATPYYGENPSVLDERYVSGITELNYTPSPELKLLYDNGYYYKWKVRANDGETDGQWSEIWVVNITAEVGIILLVDELYFGNLGIGQSNSTENTSLNPFVVENNGTVLSNVSVNASALWESVQVDSENYQFKADEVENETGSFNLTGSIMDWFNMPLTGFTVAIDRLNYTDETDSAEVDINLTVPVDEAPGQKSSTIVFLAELAE